MAGARGAEFGELYPKNRLGQLDIGWQSMSAGSNGLDSGVIFQLTPNNSFRLGQQVLMWIGIANEVLGEGQSANWITSVRLKLWWARHNTSYRQAGAASSQYAAPTALLPIDATVFGPGPLNSLDNNRYIWVPSTKRLDVTQYQNPTPPAAALPRTSDSLILDDVLKMDLRDPNDANYQAQFPPPQIPSRWVTIFYPAMGFALGATWEAETAFVPGLDGRTSPVPRVSLSWVTGTLGGTNYQEAIG